MQKASLHAASWVHEVAQRVYEMSPTTGQGKQSDRPASITLALSRASSKDVLRRRALFSSPVSFLFAQLLGRAVIAIHFSPADPVTV